MILAEVMVCVKSEEAGRRVRRVCHRRDDSRLSSHSDLCLQALYQNHPVPSRPRRQPSHAEQPVVGSKRSVLHLSVRRDLPTPRRLLQLLSTPSWFVPDAPIGESRPFPSSASLAANVIFASFPADDAKRSPNASPLLTLLTGCEYACPEGCGVAREDDDRASLDGCHRTR